MRIESFFPNSNLFSESPLTESLLKEGSIIEGSILYLTIQLFLM